jgi:2-keto-4-pentenoate hydratase/2-oxohepta-3-ene-1,7-dioic acid hydratase in catechol pathway
MRLANLSGRATLVTDDGLVDIATSSNGAFSASTEKCLSQLETLGAWYSSARPRPTDTTTAEELIGDDRLGPVIANPSQIFAIGLNYGQHAAESGLTVPSEPMVFTKFPSALCGPNAPLPVPGQMTDWEAELVIVMGTRARNVRVEEALATVAGYCVGQDYSERGWQFKSSPPQFSLGKSFENFAPIGPWLTTSDEIANPNDLAITTTINGVVMQDSATSDMVFSVARLIAYLSSVCELRRGDLIFTGTPQGVGQARQPPVFIQPGDVVVTSIEGLGTIRNVAISAS